MIANFITYAFVAAIVFSVLGVLVRIARRFPERTLHDLMPLLQPVHIEEVELLFDPGETAFLRANFSDREFRSLQRQRLYLAMEHLKRMAQNAAILAQWANHELSRSNPQTQELASELHREAVYVRVYALFARLKLNLWILLRLGPVGWLLTPDFLRCVGISGLPAYGKLKRAAASLFLHFGHPALEQFVQNL